MKLLSFLFTPKYFQYVCKEKQGEQEILFFRASSICTFTTKEFMVTINTIDGESHEVGEQDMQGNNILDWLVEISK